jgi:hypothetical protein
MSLIRRQSQTLIGLCCASVLLDLDESTIRKGLCGTAGLTQVPKGRRISLILEEVIELKTSWIEAAQKSKNRGLRLVK